MYGTISNKSSGAMSNVIVYGGLFILGLIVFVPGWVSDYSVGVRSGVITKFSHKGVFIKSWEGEMLQGGMRSERYSEGREQLTPNIFVFSVRDENVIKKLDAAISKGEAVTVKYKQWLVRPIYIDTAYAIVDVL